MHSTSGAGQGGAAPRSCITGAMPHSCLLFGSRTRGQCQGARAALCHRTGGGTRVHARFAETSFVPKCLSVAAKGGARGACGVHPALLPPATAPAGVCAINRLSLVGLAWRGVAWRGVAWRGVAWRGVATRGTSTSHLARRRFAAPHLLAGESRLGESWPSCSISPGSAGRRAQGPRHGGWRMDRHCCEWGGARSLPWTVRACWPASQTLQY